MTDVLELANTYISIDPHEDTRNEIRALVDSKDISALEKLLLSRMEFGTAGLLLLCVNYFHQIMYALRHKNMLSIIIKLVALRG